MEGHEGYKFRPEGAKVPLICQQRRVGKQSVLVASRKCEGSLYRMQHGSRLDRLQQTIFDL